jgi:hypothetical protein
MIMEKIEQKIALAKRVLVVAIVNDEIKDWAAYIDAVPGVSHDKEKDEVGRTGTKISFQLAKVIFPGVAREYKWRD